MKTRLELAHDYAKILLECGLRGDIDLNLGEHGYTGVANDAFMLADAMLAEDEKRNINCNQNINVNLYPEYDATINYPPDAWVMYQGEKRLAVSIKEEWQPDWSQAPEDSLYWCKSELGAYYWMGHKGNPIDDAPSFSYTGDWRNSLRKRPE